MVLTDRAVFEFDARSPELVPFLKFLVALQEAKIPLTSVSVRYVAESSEKYPELTKVLSWFHVNLAG